MFFCPRWGQESLSWDQFCSKVKAAGYDGVESGLPETEDEVYRMAASLQKHGLRFIAQHWETTVADFAQHLQEYERRLYQLAAIQPLFINSQTGKDYYPFARNEQLIAVAGRITSETGVAILHETHRGKFSFAAHVMQNYLERLPVVRITLDISHWCAVAETLLHDQAAAVQLAIAHTDHIHARIGHTQGAQVMDPRAPENTAAMEFHLQCWDKVMAAKQQKGDPLFTITPEFGAPPYLPLFPYTQQPIVSQWDVNLFMMDLLRKRYA